MSLVIKNKIEKEAIIMKNKSIKSKVLAGVLIASTMITSATAVFAVDTTSTTNNSKTTQFGFKGGEHKDKLKTILSDLVTEGTITSTQETVIETAIAKQGKNNGGDHKGMFTNKLTDLVTAGIITSDEQTAITTALASAK